MGKTQTLYARGMSLDDPVHVSRPAPAPGAMRGPLCGAKASYWLFGLAKPKQNEEPCPDCLAVLAAEAAVDWAGADDILAEWG